MSLLENLSPKRGSKFKERRVGRGDASGWGGTAGKGHKGQKARSGAPIPRGFEGGQTPLARRAPKFGFTNAMFKTKYNVVNLEQLEKWGTDVDPESLYKKGLIASGLLKVLGRGEIKKAITVKAHKFSDSAKKAIEAAGGKAELVESAKKKWVRTEKKKAVENKS